VAFYPRLFISLRHFVRLLIFRVAFCPGPFGLWHFVLWHFVPWHFVRTPLKVSNVFDSLIAAGNSFQIVGAEKLKERLPKLVVQKGIDKRF